MRANDGDRTKRDVRKFGDAINSGCLDINVPLNGSEESIPSERKLDAHTSCIRIYSQSTVRYVK